MITKKNYKYTQKKIQINIKITWKDYNRYIKSYIKIL